MCLVPEPKKLQAPERKDHRGQMVFGKQLDGHKPGFGSGKEAERIYVLSFSGKCGGRILCCPLGSESLGMDMMSTVNEPPFFF